MSEKVWLKNYDSWVQPELEYPDGTLYEIFARTADKHAEKAAAIFMDGECTFRELKLWTDSFAAALAAKGVKKGDRIVLSLPNMPQFIAAYYALMKLGAVAVMLNPLSVEREIDFKYRNSEAKGVIALDMFYDKFHTTSKEAGLDIIIFTGIFDFHPVHRPEKPEKREDGILDMRTMIEEEAPEITMADIKMDDLSVIIYTGGTTGDPKGATLSHRNIIYNALAISNWGNTNEEDRGIAVLPFFHGFGMQMMLNLFMLTGGSIILMPQFDLQKLLEYIDCYNPTIMVGVPTMYTAINAFQGIEKYDLSSLRMSISGGAPLPLAVKKEFDKLTGGSLIEGYGLTECSCAICANPVSGLYKEGTIGIPMSDTEMKIVDLDTGKKEIAVGESGEIIIKSPVVMMGYLNNPQATEQTIRDGWLYSGDIGKVDEDGYFYILDRKKEMIIAGGFNIYPKEVEDIIQSHPAVLENAVIGLPDEYRGETVKAFIVIKEGENLTEEEITDYCRENMVKYMVPKIFEFRNELPKSIIGKILKKELKAEELSKLK